MNNKEQDPTRNWNPIDTFWRVFYPVLNPRPDASPVKLQPPPPIWDLPSPHNPGNTGVLHPEDRQSIPYFVSPDYYRKLIEEPTHPVIHPDPPTSMILENLSLTDWLVTVPLHALTAPLFVASMNVYKGKVWSHGSLWTWFSTGCIGMAGGFTVAFMRSENRLQGYQMNEGDQVYWKKQRDRAQRVLMRRQGKSGGEEMGGVMEDEEENGWLVVKLKGLFGPEPVALNQLEQTYYGKTTLDGEEEEKGTTSTSQ